MSYPADFSNLIEQLGAQKDDFITKTGKDVEEMVEKSGRMAVALWAGETLYEPSHMNYILVVTSFICSDAKTYHGLEIRSYLAELIATKVVRLYSSYLSEHEADIRLNFDGELKKNTHLQQSIYNIIRAKLLSRCVEITRDHIANLVGNAIQTSVSNQVSIAAAHATAQHVAASSVLGPAAGVVAGLALYKIYMLPKTLGRKLGLEIQEILNGNFSQWTEDVLQKAFDDLIDSKKFAKSVGASMLDNVVITGVQDTLGNPVDVGDIKDEVELIGDVVEEMHIGKPTGLNE